MTDNTRPADVDMFQGVSSNPPADYPTELFTAVPDGGHIPEDEPIRVVVTDVVQPNNETDWSGDRYTVADTPQRIAGGRHNRIKLHITNIGLNNVYLVKNGTTDYWLGAVVPVNGILTMETNREVWAVCKPEESAEIGVIQEFTIDDGA